MGRAKVVLKPIQNGKARKSTFIQRKKGLTKKVSEFSSKFGVDVCLIVYDGYGRAMSLPQDSTFIQSMLEKYEQQKIESITPKEFDVKDYFAHKKNMVEAEISKVRNQIVAKKYPTWGSCFHSLGGDQLKTFIGIVDGKIQACNQRISMLKKMQESDETSFLDNTPQKLYIPHDPLKALDEIVEMSSLDSTPQKPYTPNDPLKELDEIDEIDFTNHVDVQQSETSFTQQNTIHMQNHVDVQQSETSLSHVWSTNLLVEPDQEWVGRFGELVELENFVPEPEQEWGVTELVNFDNWTDNKLDNDVINWISQQDVTL